MLVVLILFSAGLLGLVVYFAVSQKSSRHLKLAAFAALGLIALALGVAGFFLIVGHGEGAHHVPLPIFQEAQAQAVDDSNIAEVIIFFIVFALVMGLIVWTALKNQRKKRKG